MPRKKQWHTCMVLGMLLLAPSISSAGNPVEGSRAAAMGAAFVAVADDPSTIAHNPAGLANLRGTNLYGGVTASELSSEYKSPSGATEDTLHQYFFPPHLYFTSDSNRGKMTFGLGIYSPFGIGGRKWSEQGLTRYAATENLIATLCINPVLAFKAGPHFSIGFGIIYLGEKSITEKMVNQTALGAEDGKTSLKGQGGGWGYNLGFILFPGDTLSFGVAYRSATRIEETSTVTFENIAPALQSFFGGSKFETDADAVLHFPPVMNLGVAWRPTKFLTLSFDAEWIGWSSFDKVDLHLRNKVPQGGLTSSSIPLNWHDVWVFKVGTEYQVADNFALRAGYVYSQNPVPEDTLNPGNPDSDQQYISCGFGYKRKGITLDVFYMAEIFKDRSVQNSILSGEYKSFAQGIGFSLGYKF